MCLYKVLCYSFSLYITEGQSWSNLFLALAPAKKAGSGSTTRLLSCIPLMNPSFPGLGICSSLIRSEHSNQMSDCEQFSQITQDKWATVSKLHRSLMSKEQPWANRSGCSWQMSDRDHDKWGKWAIRSKNLTKIIFFGMFLYVVLKKRAICSFPLF